jgi:hypothetical protein
MRAYLRALCDAAGRDDIATTVRDIAPLQLMRVWDDAERARSKTVANSENCA